MKKIIGLLALVSFILPVKAEAQYAISATIVDSIAVADTGTSNIRADTVYSSVVTLGPARYLNFGSKVVTDTNFAGDVFLIDVEFSIDQTTWTTHGTAVQNINLGSADNDTTVNSTLILDADASFRGAFARFRYIHSDTLAVGEGINVLNNKYNHVFTTFYALIGN